MTVSSLMVRDVAILTPRIDVDNGDEVPNWAAARQIDTRGWVAQRSTAAERSNRDATVSGFVLFVPAGTDVTSRSRVEVDGIPYEVDGAPKSAWTPRGEHHLEVPLREVRG